MLSALLTLALPSVTFDAPANRVRTLLPALGTAMGTPLRADESVADEILLVDVRNRKPDEVLNAIAEAMGAEWRMDPDGRTLHRSAARANLERDAARREFVAAIKETMDAWRSHQDFGDWTDERSQRFALRLQQNRPRRGENEIIPKFADWGPFSPLIDAAFRSLTDAQLELLTGMANVEVSHVPRALQFPFRGVAPAPLAISANIERLVRAQRQLGDEGGSLLGPYSSFTANDIPVHRFSVAFSYTPGEFHVQVMGFDAEGKLAMDGLDGIGPVAFKDGEAPFLDAIETDAETVPLGRTFVEILASLGKAMSGAARRKGMDLIAALPDNVAGYAVYNDDASADTLEFALQGEMQWRNEGSLTIGRPNCAILAESGRMQLSDRRFDAAIRAVTSGRDVWGSLGALWSEVPFSTMYAAEGSEDVHWVALGAGQPVGHRLYGLLQPSQRSAAGGTSFSALGPSARATLRTAWDLGMFEPFSPPGTDPAGVEGDYDPSLLSFAEESPQGFSSSGRVFVDTRSKVVVTIGDDPARPDDTYDAQDVAELIYGFRFANPPKGREHDPLAMTYRVYTLLERQILATPRSGRIGSLRSEAFGSPASAPVSYPRLPAAFRAEVDRHLREMTGSDG